MQRTIDFRIIITALILLTGCASKVPIGNLTLKLEKANQFYTQGSLTDAEYLYRSVIQRSPGLSVVWFRLGNIYVRTNQLEAAINAYRQATKINPKEEQYWINYSAARLKQAQEISSLGLQYHPQSQNLTSLLRLTSGQNNDSKALFQTDN